MLASIGPIGFVVILVAALLFWGPQKLPELGKATGETIRAFRHSLSGKDDKPTEPEEETKIR